MSEMETLGFMGQSWLFRAAVSKNRRGTGENLLRLDCPVKQPTVLLRTNAVDMSLDTNVRRRAVPPQIPLDESVSPLPSRPGRGSFLNVAGAEPGWTSHTQGNLPPPSRLPE
jgi:hypothetical protein